MRVGEDGERGKSTLWSRGDCLQLGDPTGVQWSQVEPATLANGQRANALRKRDGSRNKITRGPLLVRHKASESFLGLSPALPAPAGQRQRQRLNDTKCQTQNKGASNTWHHRGKRPLTCSLVMVRVKGSEHTARYAESSHRYWRAARTQELATKMPQSRGTSVVKGTPLAFTGLGLSRGEQRMQRHSQARPAGMHLQV